MLRAILPPLASAYALFVVMVLRWSRGPAPRPRPTGGLPPPRYLLEVVGGGYLAFCAIVGVFHGWLAGEAGALAEAARGGALLLALALPSFAALSSAERWWRARRAGRPGPV
ncbi:MAG TPA: DUF6256 family protein, partial [Actinomycetota bacterium]|nr:DUF6256 family protein [Actinomycetota bacterium]